MSGRIQSFSEFWPYYLGEHRNPVCRATHFVGTTGFFGSLAVGVVQRPETFGLVLGAVFVLGFIGFTFIEPRMKATPLLLGMIALAVWAHPWVMLAAIVFAYGAAWIGHFLIEGNRPATFTYPLWSLVGDFRMWFWMLTGRLWTGDSLTALRS